MQNAHLHEQPLSKEAHASKKMERFDLDFSPRNVQQLALVSSWVLLANILHSVARLATSVR